MAQPNDRETLHRGNPMILFLCFLTAIKVVFAVEWLLSPREPVIR